MYNPGDCWTYRQQQNQEAYCRINAVEYEKGEAVFHLSVLSVSFRCELVDILHMPFSQQSLSDSLTVKMGEQAIDPEAINAIEEWRNANGGVWTISVADAVALTIDSAQS